eukprot:Amastigsp_a340855_52.p2 type:complete len:104 gc:universal Amastigsp_a340855_52:391-80(-)
MAPAISRRVRACILRSASLSSSAALALASSSAILASDARLADAWLIARMKNAAESTMFMTSARWLRGDALGKLCSGSYASRPTGIDAGGAGACGVDEREPAEP